MRLLAGRSVAVRLAASSLFWSFLILLVAGLTLSALYRQSTERSFDERLLVYANDLAADLVTPGDPEQRALGTLGDPRFDIPLSGWFWQVGRPDSAPRDLRASRSLVGNPFPELPAAPDRVFGQVRKGYATGPDDRLVRIIERDIDLGEDGRFVVRVAGPSDEISGAQSRFTAALVTTFAVLGAALGLSTLFQIRFGLKPLIDLQGAVGAIRRGESERIVGSYPRDIAPLAEELNLLIDSNREILDRARTQVGNLAHALKTPLSVIVNDTDGVPPEDLSLRVREQAAIMRHQVDYYLDRARAAALAGTLGAATDVAPVLEGLGRTFAKIYRDRELSIAVTAEEGLRFRGERQDLEEMAGNLMDNACKWARRAVAVEAAIVTLSDRTVLRIVVDDDGPGVPEAARAEAVQRGRRLDETTPGSGLGLSIVADLAASYSGILRLDSSPLGGARAELSLAGDLAA